MLWQWFGLLGAVLGGLLLGLVFAGGVRRAAQHMARRTPFVWDDVIVEAVYTPVRVVCSLFAIYALVRVLRLPAHVLELLTTFTRATSIGLLGWGLIRALYATAEAVADGSAARETNDPGRLLRARSLHTQIVVANRIISVVIFLVASAAVALQFNGVRAFGMSLLASAGVAGVVIGFAAQKSLGALLAGIQLSLSQPVRIGDSVVLEGEFGTIEDIGLTYVTVRLWDERRLIVPTPRFLEQPLQNWSRTSAGLVGSVLLKVAFDIPVAALRAEFERLIELEPLWDRRVKSAQLTDTGERTLEIRLLMSARSAPALWDLRASVREKLVSWLQGFAQGAHLPHTRVVMAEPNGDSPDQLS